MRRWITWATVPLFTAVAGSLGIALTILLMTESPAEALERITGIESERFSNILLHRDGGIDEASFFRFTFSDTNDIELIVSKNQLHRTFLPTQISGAVYPDWYDVSNVNAFTSVYHHDFGTYNLTLYVEEQRRMAYLQVFCP